MKPSGFYRSPSSRKAPISHVHLLAMDFTPGILTDGLIIRLGQGRGSVHGYAWNTTRVLHALGGLSCSISPGIRKKSSTTILRV